MICFIIHEKGGVIMKCLFFDVDGTLKSDKTKEVPESAKETVRALMKAGHKCFICTGRSYKMLWNIDIAKEMSGVVFDNGAGLYMDGKIVRTHPIPHEVVEKVRNQVEALNGGYTLMSWGDTWMNKKEEKRRIQRWHKRFSTQEEYDRHVLRMPVGSIDTYCGEDILKIDVVFETEEEAEIFRNNMDPSLYYIYAGGANASLGKRSGEIVLKGVSKGAGVKEAVEYVHGDMEETYAFGDSMNDLDMIKAVHTGIVMGNGQEELKKVGQYITDAPEDDGIMKAVKFLNIL